MAGQYTVKLKRRAVVASGTESFLFERPPRFDFTAGQFLEMTLAVAPPEDDLRSFSISSAPCEPELMITTRLRDSAFKQALRELQPGAEVQIAGPYGSFVLKSDAPRPLVFVAGGIGITPIRSILTQAAFDADLRETFLFYSNRRAEEAAFVEELARMESRPSGLRLVSTLTGAEATNEGWAGEQGRVDLDMIARYVDPAAATFYVSGPPAMVSGLRDVLAGSGIERGRIRIERFDGY